MDDVVMQEEWKDNSRMHKENFLNLCSKLRTFIQKQLPNIHELVEVERQVAVTLYYSSGEGCGYEKGNSFGLSKSSVSIIICRVAHVIAVHLGPKYITIPLIEDPVKDKVRNVFHAFSISQCLGAIDETHIEVKQPTSNSTDNINRKSLYSAEGIHQSDPLGSMLFCPGTQKLRSALPSKFSVFYCDNDKISKKFEDLQADIQHTKGRTKGKL